MKSRISTWIAAMTLFTVLAIPVRLAAQEQSGTKEQKADLSASAQDRTATIVRFDVPGAGSGSGQGTFPFAISPVGPITGNYTDASNVNHGFLRARGGAIATFDVSGAGTGSGQGTFAANINPAGEVAGYYIDGNNVNHGFLRAPSGDIATFDRKS